MRTEPRYTRCKYNNLGCKFVYTFCHFSAQTSFRSSRFLELPVTSFSHLLLSFSSFLFFCVKSSNIYENLTRVLAHDCPKVRVLVIGALADSPRDCEPVTRRDFCGRTILESARTTDRSWFALFAFQYPPSCAAGYTCMRIIWCRLSWSWFWNVRILTYHSWDFTSFEYIMKKYYIETIVS